MIHIARARLAPSTVGATLRRRLHVNPNGAVELLKQQLPDLVDKDAVASGIELRFTASRQFNVPIVEGKAQDGSAVVLKLDITKDSLPSETRGWLSKLGIPQESRNDFTATVEGIWKAWLENDLLRVITTVQPGEQTNISGTEIFADDFGLKKHPELGSLGNDNLVHPLEQKAAEGGLFYHKSRERGNIGCFGYGAGVAMSTMDALAAAGGKPANFMDGGGGATEANVRAAMDVLLSDPDIEVIFINSFGGITRMDMIANGVVEIIRKRHEEGKATPRLVIRLRGTGEEEARKILADASDVEGLEYIPDLKRAAAEAVRLSGAQPVAPSAPAAASSFSSAAASPVVFSRDGQYEATLSNLQVKEGDPVMVLGVGKAVSSKVARQFAEAQSQFHNKVAQDYGTNIVGSCAPNKGGQTFLDRPVFGGVREGVEKLKPRIASVFVPPQAAADSIIECIEAEIPLVVAYAEGVPTKDQLRVQRALRSQTKTRVIGANCPGVIFPHHKVKLGIQPLGVHSPGYIGLASRSGTISYELAAQTSALGLGQSVVLGLGGDPFPGTRTWEALQFMLDDPLTKVICLVGEVGGQMEEEAAAVYEQYLRCLPSGQKPKPVVGFIAGQSTKRGLVYGHAGAVWWEDQEAAGPKKQRWTDAGFVMAPTLGDLGGLLEQEVAKMGL
ncbi:SCS-alpha [Saitozyma sp. JCM 24511]|nr:SCS-alpha [Saitozyma sp. JCM 24511]